MEGTESTCCSTPPFEARGKGRKGSEINVVQEREAKGRVTEVQKGVAFWLFISRLWVVPERHLGERLPPGSLCTGNQSCVYKDVKAAATCRCLTQPPQGTDSLTGTSFLARSAWGSPRNCCVRQSLQWERQVRQEGAAVFLLYYSKLLGFMNWNLKYSYGEAWAPSIWIPVCLHLWGTRGRNFDMRWRPDPFELVISFSIKRASYWQSAAPGLLLIM